MPLKTFIVLSMFSVTDSVFDEKCAYVSWGSVMFLQTWCITPANHDSWVFINQWYASFAPVILIVCAPHLTPESLNFSIFPLAFCVSLCQSDIFFVFFFVMCDRIHYEAMYLGRSLQSIIRSRPTETDWFKGQKSWLFLSLMKSGSQESRSGGHKCQLACKLIAISNLHV